MYAQCGHCNFKKRRQPHKYIAFYMIFIQESYEGPDELVEKMKSLSMTSECFSAGEYLGNCDGLDIICTF